MSGRRPLERHVVAGEVYEPPRTRGECLSRLEGGNLATGGTLDASVATFPPCGWISCEHHLARWLLRHELDDACDGEARSTVLADAVLKLPVSCVLDVVDLCGSFNGQEMGDRLGFTREWARQLEVKALRALRRAGGAAELQELVEEIGGAGATPLAAPAALVRVERPDRHHLPVLQAATDPAAVANARRTGGAFRCGKIHATVTVGLCAARHRARHPETEAALYPLCASCADGAAMARPPSAARKAWATGRVGARSARSLS